MAMQQAEIFLKWRPVGEIRTKLLAGVMMKIGLKGGGMTINSGQ
jgi:hypothetical protein